MVCGVLALGGFSACAPSYRDSHRAAWAEQQRAQAATAAWYNALYARDLALREAELRMWEDKRLHGEQISALVALNAELEQRVALAEEALAELTQTAEKQDLPFAHDLARELDELRRARAQQRTRAEAYGRLLRALQKLVDSGQLKVVFDEERRVRFVAPPELDLGDPWSLSAVSERVAPTP
jgi:hypothetical protein